MRVLAGLSVAILVGAATAFLPVPATRQAMCMKGVADGLPDSVKGSLSTEQLKAIESQAEQLKARAASDLDPWFSEAEADDNTFAAFSQLEAIATPPVNETEAALAEGEGEEGGAEAPKTTKLPPVEEPRDL